MVVSLPELFSSLPLCPLNFFLFAQHKYCSSACSSRLSEHVPFKELSVGTRDTVSNTITITGRYLLRSSVALCTVIHLIFTASLSVVDTVIPILQQMKLKINLHVVGFLHLLIITQGKY